MAYGVQLSSWAERACVCRDHLRGKYYQWKCAAVPDIIRESVKSLESTSTPFHARSPTAVPETNALEMPFYALARQCGWMDGRLGEIVNVETASEKSDIGKGFRVILLNFA